MGSAPSEHTYSAFSSVPTGCKHAGTYGERQLDGVHTDTASTTRE